MGRPRKPSAIKELEGRPGVPENEPEYGELAGDAPSWLDKRGVAAWNHYFPLMSRQGVVSAGDLAVLAQFCHAAATAEAMAEVVNAEGAVIESPHGTKVNPAHTVWNQSTDQINKLGAKLGLSPADRSKVAAKNKDDGKSRKAKLLSFDGGKGAV